MLELTTHTIRVPRRLIFEESVRFAELLNKLPTADNYFLDFSGVGRVEPFALVFLSTEIERAKALYSHSRFHAVNFSSCTYAAHMGFFQAIGVNYGKHPGRAKGSTTYLPITIFDVKAMRRDADLNLEFVGERIEKRAGALASILAQQDSGDLYDTLTYSFREIIRNVVEHSEAYQFRFCAQHWPSIRKIEIAILDSGVGIRAGLSGNPHLSINNDFEALELSLMPGISGKTFDGAPKRPYDVWANSGFGLYMISRICREGGSFFIASGSSGLYLSERKKRRLDTPFRGTVLRLVLSADRLGSLSNMLGRYRDEANYVPKNVTASLASMMLSRDFKHA